MNWDDLRVFLVLARTRTLAAAAQKAGLDATTVSRRIGRLEAAVGRSLFEVGPAGHELTARGLELFNHVEAMEASAIAGTESLGTTQLTASIRVSASEGFGTWVIAPNLHAFSQANPGIAVELVASSGFLNPSRREADIAIMLARPKRGPLIVRKLTDYRLGLYGGRGTQIGSVGELAQRRLVGYVPDLIYAPELNYLHEVAEGLEPTLTSTSINAQAAMIGRGAGLGILPCFIGSANSRLERLLPESVEIERSFWVVVHRDLRGAARVQRFLQWLDELATRMQPALQGVPVD